MESATIRDVQHNLAAYLRRVEQGEELAIRRRNKIVARLIPVVVYDAAPGDLNWAKVRERREILWGRKSVPGKSASEIVRDSRGDR